VTDGEALQGNRPATLTVVTGTATEVGKTWVAASLLALARERGLSVAARKPLQSFSPSDRQTDADRLAEVTGEAPETVCPAGYSYATPMAPPMAAAALGSEVPTLAALVSGLSGSWPSPVPDLGLVEGAGGVASPLCADGDTAALAHGLGADRVVLVADPSLGVINSVRLSAVALAPLGVIVHLNRWEPADDLHRRNRAWLQDVDGFTVTTTLSDLLEAVIAPS
jgi:dethiobiotin synthetase